MGEYLSDTVAAAVLVAGFLLFVGFGIMFIGSDGSAESEDTQNGNGGGEGGNGAGGPTVDDDTVRIPVATDSPLLEPYDDRAEYEDPDYGDLNTSAVERLVVNETNEVRANRSLDSVSFSETLSSPARDHADNMSENDYVGHVNPAGETVEERYVDECDALRDGREEFEYSENAAVVWYKTVFESSLTDENVYARSEEGVAELLVDEWLASELHRENLLDNRWETVGVGVKVDENGTVFGTQAFCSVGG